MNNNSKLFKSINIAVIVLNALFLSLTLMLYAKYTAAYEERLLADNITSVANLNTSAVMNTNALFDSCNIKLKDMEQYIESNSLTLEQTLDFIAGSNSSPERYFQLIGSDYKGYLAQRDEATGEYIPLDYTEKSYQSSLFPAFDGATSSETDGIRFTAEFTDAGPTGVKFFAVYRYINLEGQDEPWTMMLAMKSRYIMDMLNAQTSYQGQSTVLISSGGDFVVNSQYYSSANLYDYLRERNELSLDERNAVQRLVSDSDSGELYYRRLSGTRLEDCVFRYEMVSAMGDERWYSVTSVPISSFEAPDFNFSYLIYMVLCLLMMIIMDVAWLNAMNRKLKTSMLREKEASLAKGSFLSRMSHEIRTPLNAVIGYNTIARNELSSAKTDEARRQAEMKVMDSLTKSEIASKHLLTIINDVLDMSAIESGKIKIARDQFDFKGMIISLTTVFYSQASAKGVNLDVVFDTPTAEWLVGDQMRTNQILTNLLSNAVKFTPEGGSVQLIISQTAADSSTVSMHFEITDTGIGMAPEYLSHIWQPFEQADSSISRRFGGTGLGLSITKNLVDIMGGTINVRSTLGKGTTFEVDMDFEPAEQRLGNESYSFESISALVVDDDVATCEYIRSLFSRCGAGCTTVTSGQDALKAIELSLENNSPFSLCLVDWRMPQMDGIETIRRIRQLIGHQLPIIILSAYDYSEIADEAQNVGVSRFISKPLFQSSLFDLLVNVSGAGEVKHEEKPTEYSFSGVRVLLAEDNSMNMEIARAILTNAGFIVDGAWNGKQAVETFEASPPGSYKAILMDIHMPELNGLQATRAIRAGSHPDAGTIPIIAMTADAFAENVAEAMEAGMNAHISKPIDIPTLFNTMQKLVKTAKDEA